MDNPKLPQVTPIPPRMQKRNGTGMMLIPSPREVEAAVRAIPKGSLATYNQIRATLAAQHMVETACPLVTGLFVRIAAEAAEEEAHAGKRRLTPYWRVVKDDGSLNPKFPGGVRRQAERLREEGHRILSGAGKRPPRVDVDVALAIGA
jgi:alkylated DNA nucleotide flippase Atl1